MKRAGIIMAAFAFTLAVGLPAQAQDAGAFAGTWTLNAEKSTMGRRGGGPAGSGGMPAGPRGAPAGGLRGGALATSMTIAVTADELTVTRGDQTIVYRLDGSEFTIPGVRGESTATARLIGGQIVVESSQTMAQGNAMTMSSEETWALEGDTLVITTVRSTPRGDNTTAMVYDKQ
jgi:hypothetical protein